MSCQAEQNNELFSNVQAWLPQKMIPNALTSQIFPKRLISPLKGFIHDLNKGVVYLRQEEKKNTTPTVFTCVTRFLFKNRKRNIQKKIKFCEKIQKNYKLKRKKKSGRSTDPFLFSRRTKLNPFRVINI